MIITIPKSSRERQAEIAEILARAIIRRWASQRRQRVKKPETAPIRGNFPLDIVPDRSVHVDRE